MKGFSDFESIRNDCAAKVESGCAHGGPCNADECPLDPVLDKQARAAMLGQPRNLESREQSACVLGYVIVALSSFLSGMWVVILLQRAFGG